ncbi:MAG: PAS domain-containing sensor histidine kinase [Tepidimonas sp.]|uniref:PAS domain-containing sensor histidine kinase n=1 Tax=Tepidimonas sp. TaxID=2002775 RepID=UPI00259D43A8|nr:PAS domain-containing sensor histidine kinase [Tepidimonas sp.]MDM7456837.1 PAS domain-containing sensor histidine kinase [Tepidimonas sp.]
MNGRRTVSLRLVLIVQFALVIAVAIAALAVLMVNWRLPQVREQQAQEQRRAAGLALLRVQTDLELAERTLRFVAHLAVGARSAATPASPLELQAVANEAAFLGLYDIALDGRIRRGVTTVDRTRPDLRSYDLGNLPVLGAVTQHGDLAWSDQYLSPVVAEPVVAVAVRAEDGFWLAELSVDRLGDSALGLQALEGVHLVIVDRTGEVIRSPDPSDRLYRRNLGHLPVLFDARLNGSAQGRLDVAGLRLEGYALQLPRLGWVVFVGYPLEMAESAIRSTLWVSTVVAGLAALTALGSVSISSAWVQRRLRASIRFAEAVARGDYSQPLPNSRIEELARLEQGLADMGRQIRQREQQLRSIVELGPTVAIQVYDRQTRILEWNPASEKILGFTRDQALGRRPADLYYSPQQQAQFEALLERLARSGGAFGPFEGEIRTSRGERRWIYSTTFPIPGPTVDEPLFVCMNIDITELKRLEEELRVLNASLEEKIHHRTRSLTEANERLQRALNELRLAQAQLVQADKLAALGSLVAGVAHELNTPIGNALMAVSTLRQSVTDFAQRLDSGVRRSDVARLLEQIDTAEDIAERNLHRASELLRSFKQVAVDQTSTQRRTFDLRELVAELALTLQPTLKRTPYRLDIDIPSGITLDSYPGPLGQVLTNLIQNAILHGFEGRDQGTIGVKATADDTWVTLMVADDGRGMAVEVQARAFDPFFTTRLGHGGSGLGLHIVHNLVTGLLGGRIDLTSAAGHGTTFLIRCPRVAPQNPASDTQT